VSLSKAPVSPSEIVGWIKQGQMQGAA